MYWLKSTKNSLKKFGKVSLVATLAATIVFFEILKGDAGAQVFEGGY